MRRLAVFVDAGYFWAQTIQAVFGRKADRSQVCMDYPSLRVLLLETAEREFADASLLRIYWYDGPGDNGKASEHSQIESLDDFKLRMGTRNRLGKQKAVDGLIIADLIGLAQNKAITEALIVSGDADLTPGVVAAQGLGLRVHLLSLGNGEATSPYLKAEVDRKCRWNEWDIYSYAAAFMSSPAPAVRSATRRANMAGRETQAQLAPHSPVAGHVVAAQSAPDAALSAQAQPSQDSLPCLDESTPHADGLRIIAVSCHEQLSEEEREEAKTGRGLPPEIDRKLLYLARRHFGARVGDADRRELRRQLKELLSADSLLVGVQ